MDLRKRFLKKNYKTLEGLDSSLTCLLEIPEIEKELIKEKDLSKLWPYLRQKLDIVNKNFDNARNNIGKNNKKTMEDLRKKVEYYNNLNKYANKIANISRTSPELKEFIADQTQIILKAILDGPEYKITTEENKDIQLYTFERDYIKGAKGDALDITYLDNGKIMFHITDASGKGPLAKIASREINDRAKKLVNKRYKPGNIMKMLNKLNLFPKYSSRYLTSVICIYDPNKKKIEYSAKGQNFFIKKGNTVKELGPTGYPIYMIDDLENITESIDVGTDDKLILYTDGVCDIKDRITGAYNWDFDKKTLTHLLKDSNKKTAYEIGNIIKDSRENAGRYTDDATLAVINIK